jgi:hypothetical protein
MENKKAMIQQKNVLLCFSIDQKLSPETALPQFCT